MNAYILHKTATPLLADASKKIHGTKNNTLQENYVEMSLYIRQEETRQDKNQYRSTKFTLLDKACLGVGSCPTGCLGAGSCPTGCLKLICWHVRLTNGPS